MASIDRQDQLTGTGIGQLRTIETIDGKQIIERLEAIDDSQRFYRYTMISGIPAVGLHGNVGVKPKGTGSSVEWRVQYLADGQPDFIVRTIVSTLLKTGLESLNLALAPRNDRSAQISQWISRWLRLATSLSIIWRARANNPGAGSGKSRNGRDRRIHRRTRAIGGAVSRRSGCARPP